MIFDTETRVSLDGEQRRSSALRNELGEKGVGEEWDHNKGEGLFKERN